MMPQNEESRFRGFQDSGAGARFELAASEVCLPLWFSPPDFSVCSLDCIFTILQVLPVQSLHLPIAGLGSVLAYLST